MSCKLVALKLRREFCFHRSFDVDFNLLMNGNVNCSLCKEEGEPITCGFYDFEWTFDGVTAAEGYFISSPWKSATGEHYHRFQADESEGTVEWKSLLISVKPAPASVDGECAVCFEGVTVDTRLVEPCGHCSHVSCATQVTKVNAVIGTIPRCAKCFAAWE